MGLFTTLAGAPATSPELAERAGVAERNAPEWLAGMAAAGYPDYDPDSARYTLPTEHAPVLATEGVRVSFGGVYELLGVLSVLDPLTEAFQTGGGVPADDYHPRTFIAPSGSPPAGSTTCSCPSGSRPCPRSALCSTPAPTSRTSGAGAAGRSSPLATAFPAGRYVGYHVHGPTVEGPVRPPSEPTPPTGCASSSATSPPKGCPNPSRWCAPPTSSTTRSTRRGC